MAEEVAFLVRPGPEEPRARLRLGLGYPRIVKVGEEERRLLSGIDDPGLRQRRALSAPSRPNRRAVDASVATHGPASFLERAGTPRGAQHRAMPDFG